MTDSLYSLPISALAILAAVLFVGSYWVGCFLLRPVLRVFVRSGGAVQNDIIGTVLSSFGVLYGLLLSLIAVAAYQNLNEVETQVENEAASLLALYRDAGNFPQPQRDKLQGLLKDYCSLVIDEQWPVQRRGEIPRGAHKILGPIRTTLMRFEPSDGREERLVNLAIEHFELMTERSRHRVYATKQHLPSVMWYVVVIGTLINFILLWLFDMRLVTQLFLGGLLAFFLGALILLIAVLDRPYRSVEFGVSPDAFILVQQVMEAPQTMAPPAPQATGAQAAGGSPDG
ncbi:hypothetical protein MalM25_16070 [Planctomycetes bacterium MalM25]|nr:hypothetical protein MalM25_16070 [Planctomycetes bacterium MalM25]